MEDKLKAMDKNKMSDKDKHERMALLAYFSQLGFDYSTKEDREEYWKEFRESTEFRKAIRKLKEIEELQKKLTEDRKLIIEEAKKRECNISELVNYFFDHPEELIELVGKNTLIKVSKNLEKLKQGNLPEEQLDTFSFLSPVEENKVREYKIIPKDSIRLSKEEEIAVISLQEIFAKNNYGGNVGGIRPVDNKTISNDKYDKYDIKPPYLKFRPSEYLKYCGLKKYKNAEGKMFYSGTDREHYLRALDSICNKKFIILYSRPYIEKGKQLYDTIKLIETIVAKIDLYSGITQEEKEMLELDLMRGEEVAPELDKKGWICIKPSFAFVDGVGLGNFYNLLPENFNNAFKSIDTSKSNYPYRFMQYFFDRTSDIKRHSKKVDHFDIGKDKLIYKLRLNKYKKEGRKKLINKYLTKCFEIAIKLGYLTRYEIIKDTTVGEKIVFYLNMSNPYIKGLNKELEA